MRRLSFVTMGLLAVALTISGCAQQPAGRADAGWITLLDGPAGLDNWNRVGQG